MRTGLLTTMLVLWGQRRLIWRLSLHQFRQQYAATLAGSVWAVMQPLATIAVFWFVFSHGMRGFDAPGKPPFFLMLLSGFLPWMAFADVVTNGTSTVLTHRFLVKKVAFPLEILPLVHFVSAAIVHGILLVVMLVVLLLYGYTPTVYMLQLPVFFLALACLSTGLTWCLSALNVFQRDVGQSVGVVVMLWFWLTPIVWPLEILGDSVAAQVLTLNPMYYVVEGYRSSVLYGENAFRDINDSLYFWCVALGALVIGRSVFHRLKGHFADVL